MHAARTRAFTLSIPVPKLLYSRTDDSIREGKPRAFTFSFTRDQIRPDVAVMADWALKSKYLSRDKKFSSNGEQAIQSL